MWIIYRAFLHFQLEAKSATIIWHLLAHAAEAVPLHQISCVCAKSSTWPVLQRSKRMPVTPFLNSDHISYDELTDPQGSPSAALRSFSAHAETPHPATQSMDQPQPLKSPQLSSSHGVAKGHWSDAIECWWVTVSLHLVLAPIIYPLID